MGTYIIQNLIKSLKNPKNLDTVETCLIKDLKSWAYVIVIDDTTRLTSSIKWCEVSWILEI